MVIIESSNISMRSEYSKEQRYEKTETLKMWIGKNPYNGENGQTAKPLSQGDMLTISEDAKEAYLQKMSTPQPVDEKEMELAEPVKQKIVVLQKMLEMLTGKKIRFSIPNIKLDENGNNKEPLKIEQLPRAPIGWGMEYSMTESYIETERMSFASDGVIRTKDGKEIAFSVELSMNRLFAEHNSINFRASETVVLDPLVINFGGSGAGLSEKKFQFDLTMDGNLNEISYVKEGSGFLALDLNQDGKINDGSELFGPKTGNGFEELANYDEDGNGWIDENDSVFDSLKIWTKDEHGNDDLFAIGEKGIGALYLGNISTPFDIKNQENELLGQVRSSSIYVKEDGTVGTIQQIDLAT